MMSADNARKTHVSPGIYTREVDINIAVKSLGITTLGLVGETVKGTAFQPTLIEDWGKFQEVFGGTNPEKFKASGYPKYELPYIAKSYTQQSNQMYVTRVLGLSGYNAGPAWAITVDGTGKYDKMVIAVIRSRGHYVEYSRGPETGEDGRLCPTGMTYDELIYEVGIDNSDNGNTFDSKALAITKYNTVNYSYDACSPDGFMSLEDSLSVSTLNYGRFTLSGYKGGDTAQTFNYAVSLNPADKDYIIKVLGTSAEVGDAPIYVEELYDVALQQGIESGNITAISSALTFYDVSYDDKTVTSAPVKDLLSINEALLTRANVGQTFLADSNSVALNINYHEYSGNTQTGDYTPVTDDKGYVTKPVEIGYIYKVVAYTDTTGKRNYWFTQDVKRTSTISDGKLVYSFAKNSITGTDSKVLVMSYDRYFMPVLNDDKTKVIEVLPVGCDLNDYKSQYRFASTPWIVSELKGDGKNIEVNKLFRFHTITDGNYANQQVKISIANIRPNDGTFDVLIRDYNDSDTSAVVLERYSKCTLIPQDANYLGYKMGTYDGTYESKSKYVVVEIIENDTTQHSIPCGFLGYPTRDFGGLQVNGTVADVKNPYLKYNTMYDDEIKNRKQYFGLSDLVGIDVDVFNFKGTDAYDNESVLSAYSEAFHLDSRLSEDSYTGSNKPTVTVDGVSGYTWQTVSVYNVSDNYQIPPRIGTDDVMQDTIYENVDLRKFTVYPCGGFDGWDVYRDERTNGDKFKQVNYKGSIDLTTKTGRNFDLILDPASIGLDEKGITSDYYAYLAGIKQYSNPQAVDINVLATPGIDYVNQKSLVEETIEMVEEDRADSIYVVTTPDKPSGAGDYIDEMYTPDEAVANLESSDIDSNYACTYYPWVKYEDTDNNIYINLPATKDVVRNFALTDNTSYPWFAPAGYERGNVECVKAHFITKLDEEDVLYEGRINPIKTFANDGVKIWGQKNLQVAEGISNRVAVRRLMLRLRKLISIACIKLIFEPNDTTTKNKFLSLVTPILDNIRSNRGLSDYQIEVDDSVEARDRRELPAKIKIKPYNALEYITIDFYITPEGASFDEI